MPVNQLALGRSGLCLPGGSAEPVVSVDRLVKAIAPEEVESLRPLLPVGYQAGLEAYRQAVQELTSAHLTDHYTHGLAHFYDAFVPHLKRTLQLVSGGIWQLEDYVAYAAGTDVDFMTHLVEAVAARGQVYLYPGDWFGFLVGCTQRANIHWRADGAGELACLCIPSVRNGHLTGDMVQFLAASKACLLNLNLFPTLTAAERVHVSEQLLPLLPKSVLSISFSRGFGLTASQLGVFLIHRDHPYRARFDEPWRWFTHFYNALASRAFMHLPLRTLQEVDQRRRAWVAHWLAARHLPAVASGSYYVKSFQPDGEVPSYLQPLCRDGVVRLCMKPRLEE